MGVQNSVHDLYEGCWHTGLTEGDNFVFIEPIWGNKCCLVAVIWVYPYLVIPTCQIQVGEDSFTMECYKPDVTGSGGPPQMPPSP